MIAVVGAGALGTAVAHFVQASGETVALYAQRGRGSGRRVLRGPAGEALASFDAEPLVALGKRDDCAALFVTVKAYDLAPSLRGLLPTFMSVGVPIIPLCNGLVFDDTAKLAAAFANYRWRQGIATIGVRLVDEREDGTTFQLASKGGAIVWGPERPDVPSAIERRLIDGERFIWQDDVRLRALRKWLFNTVANSLAASRRLPNNGALLSHRAEARALFDEALAFGSAAYGAWPWSSDELWDGLLSLLAATAANENSMARDVRLGRRTENDYLAGVVLSSPRGRTDYPLLWAQARRLRELDDQLEDGTLSERQ